MILLLFGCKPAVLKQDIPVSTNPMHAKIFVNGQPAGQTPGIVTLERNRDHILTLIKEDYRQEDVVIRKQYQSDRVFLKAVQSGVNAGLFHKNAAMGISSGYGSMSMQPDRTDKAAGGLQVEVYKVENAEPLVGAGCIDDDDRRVK